MPATVRSRHEHSPAWLVVAAVGIGYAAWDLVQWLVASNAAQGTQSDAVVLFHQRTVFASPTVESLAALACALLGVTAAVFLTRSGTRTMRRVGVALIAVGSPLALWHAWTLM